VLRRCADFRLWHLSDMSTDKQTSRLDLSVRNQLIRHLHFNVGPWGTRAVARSEVTWRAMSKSACCSLFGGKQSVDSKRIAHTHSVAWRIVVQPKGDMEIHLLGRRQVVQASGVQQYDGTSSLRIIANIFRE
jgi:hypothetical protein